MNLFHVIILSIIEGITEFLPISSTGHMILVSKVLGMPESNLLNTFEIVIQFGAILAVLVLYAKHLLHNPEIIKKVIAAFIPTGIIGFLLYKVIKTVFLNNPTIVGWSLVLGGAAIIAAEYYFKQKHKRQDSDSVSRKQVEDISYAQAVIIGFFQSLSVIPGVSRAAATIIGGLMIGMDRAAAVEFSFILAIPTMFAASGYDLLKSHKGLTSAGLGYIGLGTLISFVIALFVVKWFIAFIRRYDFIPFGVYRIVIGIFALLFLLR